MRIAQVANFHGPRSGGLRTALRALGRGYVDSGDDVLLVVPGDRDHAEDTPQGHLVTLHSPALPGSGGYRVITRLAAVKEILARFAPDALEVHDRTTLIPLADWARRRRVVTAFVAHERADGVLAGLAPRAGVAAARRLAAAHSRDVARRFDLVVATTSFAGEELARAGARVDTVPLGVDLLTFDPRRHSPLARRALARPEETLVVLASRLSSEKRPEIAVEAVRELAARGRPVRLVVAGSGPLDRRLRRRARDLPVEFVGFVDDRRTYAALLASADVLVAPGPIETFGLAALEGLASGTPAVVNRASALPEVVGAAGIGAEGTPDAFADGVEAILARDGRERRLAARSRAEELPWHATVARMRALHVGALAGLR
ncbi:glycosyltransferase [Demequina sp. SYSU T00039]|uniref:D-inositol 3-phosphate glycosyltransferase n=1 Tax=Demequina lignilytica TaxID=3051663 RepID=A0AAW7M6Z0_9MICO|nr:MULTISPECIES: glycosyltransferase [unclassified Demequina]MDN4478410.1 glycosyltransferase [Demequina sp. SYSU T00039-1]MDN4487083.1 glycosyltransferase [Demequina sp. SYSU T00039]MDN4489794.1 glycosyltransferase [Demequina sp. SYSU T00068]